MQLLKAASETEVGRRYNFSSIKSIEDFQRQVPITDYNGIKNDVERMMKGEASVLWPGETQWFAKSSGTTSDRSKFIPVTKEALYDCHFKAGKDMYAMYYSHNPEANLVDGKTLVLGGSHQIHQLNSKTSYGDLSAVLLQHLPFWAEMKRVPDLSIALMDNWEEKIEKMAQAVKNESVTNILGVPTWTIVLIKRLFEITGKNDLSEIWPNLQLYVHGGVSFTPYREVFRKLIHSPQMYYQETYNASEGYFAIQNDLNVNDMLLMLDYGIFFEFIPTEVANTDEEYAVPLEDVQIGKNYELVITTNSGLWRYRLGDTVKFTSLAPHKMVVSGRTKFFINAFGEEVIVDNAEKALSVACERTAAQVADYTAAPVYFSAENAQGAHEWFIEFENMPNDIDHFTETLDQTLREINSDYDAKRTKNMALMPPVINVLKKGTFYAWMKKRGKLGGQHKVPRLSNDRIYADELKNFIS